MSRGITKSGANLGGYEYEAIDMINEDYADMGSDEYANVYDYATDVISDIAHDIEAGVNSRGVSITVDQDAVIDYFGEELMRSLT